MTPDQLWQRYADLWSADAAPDSPEFEACLAEDIHYCDPNGPVAGRAALARYMAGFRAAMPGTRFHIAAVASHNGRTLSEWSLRSADDAVLQTGRSFAQHDDRGRLRDITGFFDPQAASATAVA
jgi:hypothetical protein